MQAVILNGKLSFCIDTDKMMLTMIKNDDIDVFNVK